MNAKEEILSMLRNLSLDRTAAGLMRKDIASIEKDMKKELPTVQREALEKERLKLLSSLTATEHHIGRVERLLSMLSPEEQAVLDKTIINPYPEAVFDLAEELSCETSSVYRVRASALSRLARLRFGAGE